MSEFRNREKRQALLFITLGLVVTLFSYQNFHYPETIKKSEVDVGASLDASDLEIQKTRQNLNPEHSVPIASSPRTQVIESNAPLKLKLKRAPAKSVVAKKKKKKPKKLKKTFKKKKSKKKKTQKSG